MVVVDDVRHCLPCLASLSVSSPAAVQNSQIKHALAMEADKARPAAAGTLDLQWCNVILNPFQIIVHLTFFNSKFDHSSHSKIYAKYHFFLL
jgi:hypothetical protein